MVTATMLKTRSDVENAKSLNPAILVAADIQSGKVTMASVELPTVHTALMDNDPPEINVAIFELSNALYGERKGLCATFP